MKYMILIGLMTSLIHSPEKYFLYYQLDKNQVYIEASTIPYEYQNKLESGDSVSMQIFTKKGRAKVKLYDKNKRLLREGYYQDGIGETSEYVTNHHLDDDRVFLLVQQYTVPYMIGEWYFWDSIREGYMENFKYNSITYRGSISE